MNKRKIIVFLTMVMCLGLFLVQAYAGAVGDGTTEPPAEISMRRVTNPQALKDLAAKLALEESTAVFNPSTNEISVLHRTEEDEAREARKTYITRLDVSVFGRPAPINIVLPQEQDAIIINVDGMVPGEQYKFMAPLKFNGEDVPKDNGREAAGRVLLNFNTYEEGANGFLDFFKTDSISVLAPAAIIKLPCSRVEMIVAVDRDEQMYGVEVDRGSSHAAVVLENDIIEIRDFTLPKKEVQQPTEEPSVALEVPPDPSKSPSESEDPAESESQNPEPSESPAPSKPAASADPSPSQSAASADPSLSQSVASADPSLSQSAASADPAHSKPAASTSSAASNPPASASSAPSKHESSTNHASSKPEPPIPSESPTEPPAEDLNHVAYVPDKSVGVGSGHGSADSATTDPVSTETPGETAPVLVETGDPMEEYENSVNRISTVLKVGIVLMAICVVNIIAMMYFQWKEKNSK